MKILSTFHALTRDGWKSRAMKAWFFSAVGLLVITWALAFWKLLPLRLRTEPVVLHYSVSVGIDRLGPWYWTFFPAVLAVAIFLFDGSLSFLFWRKGRPEIALLLGIFVTALLALLLIATALLALSNVSV